jgi:CheY-like chemotaxis protein
MHFANSGEAALQQLTVGIEPTLIVILSDINMPGMDGLQLLGEIKQHFSDIPVMMVTASGDDERRRRASDLGAAEFLTKPVDFDTLKAQCESLRHRLGEQQATVARVCPALWDARRPPQCPCSALTWFSWPHGLRRISGLLTRSYGIATANSFLGYLGAVA